MVEQGVKQKTVVVGAGPVGALAAIYAARRGDNVEVYELRDGQSISHLSNPPKGSISSSVDQPQFTKSSTSLYIWAICCSLGQLSIHSVVMLRRLLES
jgi:glycine/D-amino acid oxidase-like deaminating enzyme